MNKHLNIVLDFQAASSLVSHLKYQFSAVAAPENLTISTSADSVGAVLVLEFFFSFEFRIFYADFEDHEKQIQSNRT